MNQQQWDALHSAYKEGEPVALETMDNYYPSADIIELDEEHILFSAWNEVKGQVREYRVSYAEILQVVTDGQ